MDIFEKKIALIRKVYEDLGFEWEQVKPYVELKIPMGALILPTPELKKTLKGYDNLIKQKQRPPTSFSDSGLSIYPNGLSGLHNNNGWSTLSSEDDLPVESKLFYDACYFEQANDEVPMFFALSVYGLKKAFQEGIITHYKPTIVSHPPLV